MYNEVSYFYPWRFLKSEKLDNGSQKKIFVSAIIGLVN